MKKLVAIIVLAFALLVGLECNAQQSVRIYSATELQGHHLQPIGGDYEGFCPKDLYDLAVEEGARAPEIKKTILALTGEKNIDFLNDNKNFRLAEDTTLLEGSYYNSAWDETSQKIVFFLGKRKEHCSIYFFRGKMFYIEACANFLFKSNSLQTSDLPSRMEVDDKVPLLAEYGGQSTGAGAAPTPGTTTVNLTVNCNGCEQEQQYQQQPYYGGTYYQSYPQPYYGYGYGVSYGISYSTTPIYNNYHHHNNNYYGRRHDNYNRGTTYYRYERTTGGGPGGAPGNGPGGAPGNGPRGTPGNGGPGGAPGHGGRR